jgi:hypothetical protein
MANEKTNTGLLALLRRRLRWASAFVAVPKAPPPSSKPDDDALSRAHDRATSRARDSANAAARLASSIASQRGSLDGASDRMRIVAGRAQELADAAARIVDGFERLGLVGLNTGLEGARLGENAGRALLLVADEVRGYAIRGSEASRELSSSMADLSVEMTQVAAQLGQVRDTSNDVAEDAAHAASSIAEVLKALFEVGGKGGLASATEPASANAVAEAEKHAQALVGALRVLRELRGNVPRARVVGVLRLILEPVVRLLREDEREDEKEIENANKDEGAERSRDEHAP